MRLPAKISHYLHQHKKMIVSFCIVGLLTAIISIGSFAFFWNTLKFGYVASLTLSTLLAIVFHFISNSRLTFKNHNASLQTIIPRYLFVIVLNYLIALIAVSIAVEQFNVSPYFGIVFSIAVNTNIGFFLSRYWVFKKTSNA
jgi:putative flippase GtrA